VTGKPEVVVVRKSASGKSATVSRRVMLRRRLLAANTIRSKNQSRRAIGKPLIRLHRDSQVSTF
jgi:hypothetical protein